MLASSVKHYDVKICTGKARNLVSVGQLNSDTKLPWIPLKSTFYIKLSAILFCRVLAESDDT